MLRPRQLNDSTAAIVSSGKFTYTAQDVDALNAIASRHLRQHQRGGLSTADQTELSLILPDILVARESLLMALAMLPEPLQTPSAARDALILDILDCRTGKCADQRNSGATVGKQHPRRYLDPST